MTSLLSREALFLFNNLLFMGILVVCFWGVIFPLISELFTGQKVTVGPPFYERATGPLFAGLLFLMGIAPSGGLAAFHSQNPWQSDLEAMIFAGLVTVVLAATGVRSLPALLTFLLCALVLSVTLYEFWRGALARHRKSGEACLWRCGIWQGATGGATVVTSSTSASC